MSVAPAVIGAGYLGQPRLLRGLDTTLVLDHAAHRRTHGETPLPELVALLALLDTVALRGRGGAAFPLADKIRALRRGRPVVVVNGSEGEPASAKDGLLLSRAPHLVLDGAATVASAIGAGSVLVAVTDSAVADQLRRSVSERPDGNRFEIRRHAPAFVGGQAQALVNRLDGGPGRVPGRAVHNTDRGVGGAPTLASNAETFAQVAVLTRAGAPGFAALGTAADPGTTLLTVSGSVDRPAVLEVPFGTTIGSVAALVGARPAQAVVVGGYHGTWLSDGPALLITPLRLAGAGAHVGAGVVAFVGAHTCPLGELARVTGWLAEQSARQCGPCTFGLPALAADVAALHAGSGDDELWRRHADHLVGRGACRHPDGAVRFVTSGLAHAADDIATHQAHGHCGRPTAGDLVTDRHALIGAVA